MKTLRQYNYNYCKQGRIYVYIKDLFKQLIVVFSIQYHFNSCTELLMLAYQFAQSLSFCQAHGLYLVKCFSKCGPKNNSISSILKHIKMQIPGPHSRPAEGETLGMGLRNCARISHPGDSGAHQGLRTTDLVQCFSTSPLLTSQVVFVVEGCCCSVGCLRHPWTLDAGSIPPSPPSHDNRKCLQTLPYVSGMELTLVENH